MVKVVGRGINGAGIALALLLSACSTFEGVDTNPGSLVSGGRDLAAEAETMRRFAADQVCPEVQVREGTQVMRMFERGRQDDPAALTFQGTIKTFARECRVAPDGGSVIKVGVAGRLISGPTGATGTVNLPLRVVLVKNGSEVVYSQMHPVAATLGPGQGSVSWTQVVDGIAVPFQETDSRFLIYVGFDESAPTGKG